MFIARRRKPRVTNRALMVPGKRRHLRANRTRNNTCSFWDCGRCSKIRSALQVVVGMAHWPEAPILCASMNDTPHYTDDYYPQGFVSALQRALVVNGARDGNLNPFTETDVTGVFDKKTRDTLANWKIEKGVMESSALERAVNNVGPVFGCNTYRSLGLDVGRVVPLPGVVPNAERTNRYIEEGLFDPSCTEVSKPSPAGSKALTATLATMVVGSWGWLIYKNL